MVNYQTPDFTQHPPRSPRVRLGGFVHLPRLLDKARAHLAGKLGDYLWGCPLDKRFCDFTGVTPEAMLAAVQTGKSDSEMLAWVLANAKPQRSLYEIAQWSAWMEGFGPGGAEGHAWVVDVIKTAGPERTDIRSFFDILDLDDYHSFGGRG